MINILQKNYRLLSRSIIYCTIFIVAIVLLNIDHNFALSKVAPDGLKLKENKISSVSKIMEINFSYDADVLPALKITKINKKNGYAPLYEPLKSGYALRVVNNAGKVVKNLMFEIPDKIDDPPFLNGEKQLDQILVLKKVDFALTVDWVPSMSEVTIINPNGIPTESMSLTNIAEINNNPNFKSFTSAIADATSTQNILDIAFIGDDYITADDLNKFNNDVDRFIAYQLLYEPFKSRAAQIAFHRINNTVDLGCTYSGRLITCNDSLVMQEVNNSGTPYDKIAVIVNNSTYGGSGGQLIAVTYNGALGQQVFVHEFGHTIGSLLDEYNLYSVEGLLDNNVHANCFAGTPPAIEWINFVAIADYSLGCYYPNWYRSFPGSIMSDLGYEFFNAISQKSINNSLNYFAGIFTDAISPITSINSPLDNSLVSGTITITTNVADNNGVARAELWKDGELFHTTYVAPFSFSWSTTQDTDGYHTIQVKAYDVAGNAGISPIITVMVNNYSDITPPTIIIDSPPNGSKIKPKGTLKISASASDTNGINNIQLFLDGNNIKTCFSAAFCSTSVMTSSLSLGPHLISAKAYDPAGNIGEASITVYK